MAFLRWNAGSQVVEKLVIEFDGKLEQFAKWKMKLVHCVTFLVDFLLVFFYIFQRVKGINYNKRIRGKKQLVFHNRILFTWKINLTSGEMLKDKLKYKYDFTAYGKSMK